MSVREAARRRPGMPQQPKPQRRPIQASRLIGALRLRCSRNFEFRDIGISTQHRQICVLTSISRLFRVKLTISRRPNWGDVTPQMRRISCRTRSHLPDSIGHHRTECRITRRGDSRPAEGRGLPNLSPNASFPSYLRRSRVAATRAIVSGAVALAPVREAAGA
jgi:hypothetical protein